MMPAEVEQPVLDDVAQTLAFLHEPGTAFEVCLINPPVKKHRLWNGFAGGKKPIVAGWFDDVGKAADVIKQINDQVQPDGIYLTLNPCNPALLARANNRLKAGVGRTKDNEITSICHLLIDLDPVRPAGVSATESEKEAARDTLKAVYDYLKGEGWPEPVVADSGNGGHILHGLELENNRENVELVKAVLQSLDRRFSTDQVKVDTSVFNPARISKVYGTTARKGDSTNDRPHRKATILSMPAEAHSVPLELLQKLAGEVVPPTTHRPTTTTYQGGSRLDVEAYLARYGIPLKKVKPYDSSTLYVLETCLFDETHTGGEAAIGQAADGKLFYQCFHNSCEGRTWHDARELISGNDKLFEQTLPASSVATPTEWPEMIPRPEQGDTDQAEDRPLNATDVRELLKIEFPPRRNLLSPWLPKQGLCQIHAFRGVGKTFVSLGVAGAVATGSKFLGWEAENPNGVLYIDGEMPAIVLQERIACTLAGMSGEGEAPFKVITPDLQKYGIPDLATIAGQQQIERVLTDDIKLIIVDNISTVCRSAEENKGDSWLVIQEWALRQRAEGRSVLLIHHDGKSGQQRGTSRREDVLDTVIQLTRPANYTPDQGAVFEVHFRKNRGLLGKDVKPFEAQLRQVDNAYQWTVRTLEDSKLEKVKKLLEDGYLQKEIAAELELSCGYVSKLCKKIAN